MKISTKQFFKYTSRKQCNSLSKDSKSSTSFFLFSSICSGVGIHNSHVGTDNSHVGMVNSDVGTGNSHIGMVNSHIGTGNSHVGIGNSGVGIRNSHVGMGNSDVGIRNSDIGKGAFLAKNRLFAILTINFFNFN